MQKLKTYAKQTLFGLLSLVFFANVTFAHSIDFHTCQGELQSIAFFGEKATCSKMMEMEAATMPSCCDRKKEIIGVAFKQKSCCDSVQLLQDQLLNHPDVDNVKFLSIQTDIINDSFVINIPTTNQYVELPQEEIPDPPEIASQHTQEKLQVFII